MDAEQFDWKEWVLRTCSATAVRETTLLQNLWGGYGQLLRLSTEGGDAPSVILKRVVPPVTPEGSVSDRRKRRSYEVEQAWYADLARRCDQTCRVARCLGQMSHGGARLLLLEDLELAGYSASARPAMSELMTEGLQWLAHFHSRFLGTTPNDLWPHGGYWHLRTRREEWERMPRGPWKEAAPRLDQLLRDARYQTLMHGDSKPANFCWSKGRGAAAVDFQYVGAGCGIRDVAYFLDCCLDESGTSSQGEHWLDVYFESLRQALRDDGHEAHSAAVEAEWRALFPVAWSDFQRFYQGWSGRAPAPSAFSRQQLTRALALP